MKIFVSILLALASVAFAEDLEQGFAGNTAYGYLKNFGIPQAERIRKAEKIAIRIAGGAPAGVGQYEYQAGLLLSVIGFENSAVCGGSLISANRVITAAHCWFDGVFVSWRVTVVLGSNFLFSGGIRLDTSIVATHPSFIPALGRNDVAIIYLPSSVTFSNTIGPVALPSGNEINNDFAGESAIVTGFGITSEGGSISPNQFLSHVSVFVIPNSLCTNTFPFVIQPSNLCTSGVGGVGTCRGDSGGPLVVTSNNRRILIGVVSFGSGQGCQANRPAAYARVTSFVDFINLNL